ncbi:unnamed protein product [Enterobius vermicularis]|uniref:SORBS2 n=1 Tax=Enterobius vermicularis TaxID=51028 RepID=A0A0N4VDD1_ENTVE|nr:unnamed protein product [Enterobius vermicularis]
MASRGDPGTNSHLSGLQTPRQMKKVSVPLVPDIGDMKVKLANSANGDHCSSKSSSSGHSRGSIMTPDKASEDQNSCYSSLYRPSTLQPLNNDRYGIYTNSSFKCHKRAPGKVALIATFLI